MISKRASPDSTTNRKRIKTTHQTQSQSNCDHTGNTVPDSLGPAGEAEIGIIESITLENFMCHKKLHFEFGSNVNFIIGRNGSGKSAILTGIILGLGGRANVTSRGQNVKSFIATGKSFSVIEIKLRNRGSEAFDPAKYGSCIIVERRITIDGASTYKIKSGKGKTMASSKGELTRILDKFNIQVENPVSILNQETSRNFLNSANSKDKYRFFAKATLLEQINLNYNHALERLSMGKDVLKRKQEILPTLEKELKIKEHDWRTLQSLDLQRVKINDLWREYVWCIVFEKERNIQVKKQSLDELKEASSNVEERVKNIGSELEKCQSCKNETEAELKGINEKLQELKPMFTQLKKDEIELIQDKRTKELVYRKNVNTGQSQHDEIEMLTNNIAELKSAGNQDFTEERRLREEQIANMMRVKDELQAKLVTTQNHLEQLKGSVERYEHSLFNHKQEDRNIQKSYDSKKRTLGNLEASRSNSIKKYGIYIPAVLNNIEAAFNSGQFIKRPFGPIGAYVHLNDPSLDLAIECCIGNVLPGFCCDNYQDEKVLIKIFQTTIRDGTRPPITVCKFSNQVYDVSRNAVICEEYPSILNSLTITNPIAANCLIDVCEIESTLLVKDSDTARRLMLYNPPPNCRKTYTGCGDLIYPKPNFRYYSTHKRKAKFLTVSVEDQIIERKKELEALLIQRETLRGQIQEAEKNYQKNVKEINSCEAQLVKTRPEISKLNLEIDQLKNVVDPEPPNFAVLEEELLLLKRKQVALEEKLKVSRTELETAVNIIDENRSKINGITTQKDQLQTLSDPLTEKYRKQIDTLNALEEENAVCHNQLKDYKGQMMNLANILKKLRDEVEILERDSLNVCARTYTERSRESLNSQILEMQKLIATVEENSGNREDVLARYENAKRELHNIKCQISQYQENVQKIQNTLTRRLACLKKFRGDMEYRIKFLFVTSLSVRGYKGKLVIKHKEETLSLQVQPSEDTKELQGDTRSLSGGERSFSTVCFILSLWDAMESPFRILDEYDVFMDMVNRRLSMGMMLDTAQEKSNHQFLFLSPLDMPLTKKISNMKICRMPDPERGRNSQE